MHPLNELAWNFLANFSENPSLLKNSFMLPSGPSASVESIPFERLEPRFGRLEPHWEAQIGVAATFSTGWSFQRTSGVTANLVTMSTTHRPTCDVGETVAVAGRRGVHDVRDG